MSVDGMKRETEQRRGVPRAAAAAAALSPSEDNQKLESVIEKD